MATMNISLPDAMKTWVETRVSGGQYANVSDFIRDIIRKEQNEYDTKLMALRQALEEGERSALVPYDFDEIMKKINDEEDVNV